MGGIIFLVIVLFFVWLGFREKWFPKKPKGFRLLIKQKGRYEYYRIQVYRSLYGWSGFYVFIHSGSIRSYSGWSRDKQAELQYGQDYIDLCGLNPDDYVIKEVTL
jgi:hypothetical protein